MVLQAGKRAHRRKGKTQTSTDVLPIDYIAAYGKGDAKEQRLRYGIYLSELRQPALECLRAIIRIRALFLRYRGIPLVHDDIENERRSNVL